MGHVRDTSRYPAVRAGTVSATSIQAHRRGPERTAPDDHLAASPNRGVSAAWRGRVGCAGRCPAIATWVVSAASVAIVKRELGTAPAHHLPARPPPALTNP